MKNKGKRADFLSHRLPPTLLLLLLLLLFQDPCCSLCRVAGAEDAFHGRMCSGSMAECGQIEEEFSMESETSRRILQSSKYITYGALRRDQANCGGNCQPGRPYQANPRTRGCQKIYGCSSTRTTTTMKSVFLHIGFLLFFTLTYLSNCAFSTLADPFTTCNGSIAECNEEDEMLMVSEITRRFLEQGKYISPGALKKDQPVCDGPNGQAYSKGSCLPQPSNPKERGCSKYYQCRSG